MTQDETQQCSSIHVKDHASDQVARLHGLLLAWDKLFSIGPLYEHTNSRFTQVTQGMFASWEKALGSDSTLSIEMGRDAFSIQSNPLDLDEFGRHRLISILRTLGIARLEVDLQISTEDLHKFVIWILRLKNEVEVASQFRQFESQDLPETILITQRKFGSESGEEAGQSTLAKLVDQAVEQSLCGLEERPLSEEEQQSYRDMTQEFFKQISEHFNLDGLSDCDEEPDFIRSFQDVLNLGVKAVQHRMTKSAGDSSKQEQEISLPASDPTGDGEPLTLVEEILRDIPHETRERLSRARPERNTAEAGEFELSIAELQRELDRHSNPDELAVDLEPDDKAEYLSILLQILFGECAPEVLAVTVAQIHDCLAGSLKLRETQVLLMAMEDLLCRADHECVDRILPQIIAPLHDSNTKLLILLFRELCSGSSEDKLEAVWPHLVDEILLDSFATDAKSRKKLHEVASSLPAERMVRAVKRLECLQAVPNGKFAEHLFEPVNPDLHPVFAALLFSSCAKEIGAYIHQGFCSQAPEGLVPIALELLGAYKSRNRKFYVCALRAGTDEKARRELQERTGRLLLEALESLPSNRRSATWAPEAIAALGSLLISEAMDPLNRIHRERKFRFLPVWPSACRKAANTALSKLRSVEADQIRAESDVRAP